MEVESKKDEMKEKLGEDVEQPLPATKGGEKTTKKEGKDGDLIGHPAIVGGGAGGGAQRVVLPGAIAVRGVGAGGDLADESLAGHTAAEAAVPPSMGQHVSLDAVIVPDETDFEDAVQQRLEKKMQDVAKAEVVGSKGGDDSSGAVDGDGKARRNTMIMTLFGLGVVCFAIALAAMLSYGNDDGSGVEDEILGPPADSTEGSSDGDLSAYELAFEQIKSISDEDALMDSSTPQYESLEWISKHDPTGMELIKTATAEDADDSIAMTKFVERYVLGLLYFSTGGQDWFSNVTFLSEASVCDWTEAEATDEEGEGDDGSNSTEAIGEEFEDTRKFGIRCNDMDKVVEIKLYGNNLNGTLPSELSELSSLEGLDLNGNAILGTIPTEWSDSLLSLQRLNLGYNELQGPIPSGFSKFRKMNELQMAHNDLMAVYQSYSK